MKNPFSPLLNTYTCLGWICLLFCTHSLFGQETCNVNCGTVAPGNFVTSDVDICMETDGLAIRFSVCYLPTIPEGNEISYFSYFWDFGDGQFAIVNDMNTVGYRYRQEQETRPKAYVQITSVYTDDRIIHPDSAKMIVRKNTAPWTWVDLGQGNTGNSLAGVADCGGEQIICQLELAEERLGVLPVRSLVPGYAITYVLAISSELWSNTQHKSAFLDFESTDYFQSPEAWTYGGAYQQYELGELDGNKLMMEMAEVSFPENTPNDQHYVFVSFEANESLIEEDSVELIFGFGEDEVRFMHGVSKEHDPNYKRVEPLFICENSRVPESINYTLGFTNQGDQLADSINIVDHLPQQLLDHYELDTNSISVVISKHTVRHKSQVSDLTKPFFTYKIESGRNQIKWRLRGVLLLGAGMEEADPLIEDLDLRDILGRIKYTLHRTSSKPVFRNRQLVSHAEVKFGELESMATGFSILRRLDEGCCDLTLDAVNHVDIDLLGWARKFFEGKNIELAPVLMVKDPIRGNMLLKSSNFRPWLRPKSYRYQLPKSPDLGNKVLADTLIFWAIQPPPKKDREEGNLLLNDQTRYHQIALRICRTTQTPTQTSFPTWLIISISALAVLLLILLLALRKRKGIRGA